MSHAKPFINNHNPVVYFTYFIYNGIMIVDKEIRPPVGSCAIYCEGAPRGHPRNKLRNYQRESGRHNSSKNIITSFVKG